VVGLSFAVGALDQTALVVNIDQFLAVGISQPLHPTQVVVAGLSGEGPIAPKKEKPPVKFNHRRFSSARKQGMESPSAVHVYSVVPIFVIFVRHLLKKYLTLVSWTRDECRW
jgi:hypothetical protein